MVGIHIINESGMSTGEIIGASIGATVGLALLSIAIRACCCPGRQKTPPAGGTGKSPV
ncbi:hypothetical protein T439DRAFT_354178 [Meredithblackwellia eburnea MCA 4105]